MKRAALVFLFLAAACEKKPAPATTLAGSPSATTSAAAADDLGPPVEVKAAAPPKFSLAKLDEKDLQRFVAGAGFTVTLAGHTPSGSGESAIKVGGYKKDAEGNLECTVTVVCAGASSPAPGHSAGEAWYAEGPCQMTSEVRRGIRKKSAESRRLLEQILRD
jgi:hypothetical protein